jgi:hypothetical protein
MQQVFSKLGVRPDLEIKRQTTIIQEFANKKARVTLKTCPTRMKRRDTTRSAQGHNDEARWLPFTISSVVPDPPPHFMNYKPPGIMATPSRGK